MEKARARAAAARLLAAFEARGAVPVEADILLPAATLIDLYGEDIRARAYVTHDVLRGEAVLRPDFTVPVLQRHLALGAGPARYTYAGEVFRMPPEGTDRPAEYLQVGYEVFGGGIEADAEVFAAFHAILAPLGLAPATGDIGLLRAAVAALSTTPARKAALLRHLWRPRRFRDLVTRFRNPRPVADPPARAVQEIGLRTAGDVARRLQALREDAAAPPLSGAEADALDALLAIRAPSSRALSPLRDIAVDLPALSDAVDRFAARLDALDAAGIDAAGLPFEASYGRTTLEYYDGFVFGFSAPGRPDLPPVATGGRYDALTRALGGDEAAVGGVIRPGLLVDLEDGA